MKSYLIKSIIRAAACYHLYYNGHSKDKNEDTKDLGYVGDLFSCLETKQEYKHALAEFDEVLSKNTQSELAVIEALLSEHCSHVGLSKNQFILSCAANTIGDALHTC